MPKPFPSTVQLVLLSRALNADDLGGISSTPVSTLAAALEAWLEDEPLASSSSLFDVFRSQHKEIERRVRSCGDVVEYAIVRAPERVVETRRGSIQPLTISQVGRSSNGLGFIGTLDLAEAVVAAITIDVERITFTPEEAETSSILRETRSTYYSILDMDDSNMKTSYMMKPREAYLSQLEEDKATEIYWAKLFEGYQIDQDL